MRRPSIATYLLGNGPVMFALVLLSLATLYAWWEGLAAGGAAILAFVAMSVSVKARERLNAYQHWKRQWEQLGVESGSSLGLARKGRRGIGMVCVALVILYCAANAHDPLIVGALLWLVGGLCCLGVYHLRKRKAANPKQHTPDEYAVNISIRQPLMEIPPLEVAYRQLPCHCARLLGSTPVPQRRNPRERQ